MGLARVDNPLGKKKPEGPTQVVVHSNLLVRDIRK